MPFAVGSVLRGLSGDSPFPLLEYQAMNDEVAVEETEIEDVETEESSPSQETVDAEPPEPDEQEQSEEESGDETEPTDEDKPKRKPGIQKRIDELTRQKYEAIREAEEAKERADHFAQLAQQQQQPAKAELQAPSPDNFDDYDQYVSAVASYQAQQTIQKAQESQRQAQQQDQQRQYQAKQAAQLQVAFDDAREKYADFDQVALNPQIPITPVMRDVLAESDAGGEIAYYLGKNIHIANRLAGMSPIAAAREIGRIEANMSRQPVAPPPTPPVQPVTTVGGKTPATKKVDPDKLSPDEWLRWRNKQLANKRG